MITITSEEKLEIVVSTDAVEGITIERARNTAVREVPPDGGWEYEDAFQNDHKSVSVYFVRNWARKHIC